MAIKKLKTKKIVERYSAPKIVKEEKEDIVLDGMCHHCHIRRATIFQAGKGFCCLACQTNAGY